MIRAAILRWMPVLAAGLALAGLVPSGAHAVDTAPVSAAWSPNEDDSWLFDLRSGQYRLGDGVRGYQTPQGICVDLADIVLALDLPVRVDRKLRRATGWVFDERRSLTIDREAGEVRAGSASYALTPTTIRDTAAGWCVDLDALSKWLGVPVAADLSNAVLRIETKEKLPFQLAAERRARGAAAQQHLVDVVVQDRLEPLQIVAAQPHADALGDRIAEGVWVPEALALDDLHRPRTGRRLAARADDHTLGWHHRSRRRINPPLAVLRA